MENLISVKVELEANPQTAAAQVKGISRLRPKLAIVLGSGFHYILTGLRVEKPVAMRSLLD